MQYLLRSALMLLPVLAGCSGGGPSTSQVPYAPVQTASIVTANEAQSDAESSGEMRLPAIISSGGFLYIGNVGSNSITVYKSDAAGNASPLRVIGGSNTGIDGPGELAQDAQGNLYVANGGLYEQSGHPAILVFAPGASGNVAPIRRLAGPATGITRVESMTVDRATGKIFVFEDAGGSSILSGGIRVLRFAAGANGNVAPYANAPAAFPALQLAIDSSGANLIEAHSTNAPSAVGFGIETLGKRFANNVAPVTAFPIGNMYAYGVAADWTTKTYLVSSGTYGIYRLAEATTGSGPLMPPARLAPAPVSVITSDTCGSQLGVGAGPAPATYVVHGTQSGCVANGVFVYGNKATGNAAPLRVLSGPNTLMNQPYGIYVGQ